MSLSCLLRLALVWNGVNAAPITSYERRGLLSTRTRRFIPNTSPPVTSFVGLKRQTPIGPPFDLATRERHLSGTAHPFRSEAAVSTPVGRERLPRPVRV